MKSKPTHEERAREVMAILIDSTNFSQRQVRLLAAQFAEVETLVEERMVDREEVGEMNDRIAALEKLIGDHTRSTLMVPVLEKRIAALEVELEESKKRASQYYSKWMSALPDEDD